MKRLLAAFVLAAGVAFGEVPQFEFDVDSQKPAATWTIKTYRGATPLFRVNMYEDETAWTPTNAMTGFFWYGTNANWNATSTVQVACQFATNASYTDIQAVPTTFAATGTYYGGIVMSNASGTEIVEWGRGYVQVLPSGGIQSSGLLDLRSVIKPIAGMLVATNNGTVGQVFVYSTGTISGVVTGRWSSSAAGDMTAAVYDPGNQQTGLLFTNDARYLAALTNASAFDASGTASSLVSIHDTNASSHSSLLQGYVATNGNGAGVTNVNAAMLQGYTVDQLIAPSVVYYVWGSLFSGFDTPSSNKLAQLASPAGQPVWTSTVANVANSTNIGYASIKTNERPRILKTGLWKVHLSCLRSGNVQPRTMRAHLRVYESDGVTVVTNLNSDLAEVSAVAGNHSEFVGTVPDDIVITDSFDRCIQVYFETMTGWTGAETLYVYSQNGELTYIELPSVGVLVEAIDSTARTNAAIANDNATNAQSRVAILETNAVIKADTNGWTVSSHASFVQTNDARYLAALTNSAEFATAAQGVAATNAQARVSVIETNYASLNYASQAALAAYQDATNYSLIATTNEIAIHNTNTLAHLNLASVAYVTNQLAGYVQTNVVSYYAAPACYQVTITNLSETWFTNVFNPTQSISRVTATSTGKMNFVMNWPANQVAYWGFCYDATGMPSTVFPEGAIYYTNGVFSATAPTLGKSNYVSVMHSCASYQIMAFTNSLGTWGTP